MMRQKPEWLKIQMIDPAKRARMTGLLKQLNLHTVCEEANCPNRMECFGRGTATFMILGSVCTRNCAFCAVTKGKPQPIDPGEPESVAQAVKNLGLRHAVITTVTRDDLPDGGAGVFAEVIRQIRAVSPKTTVEVLISDLRGDWNALKIIAGAGPEILGHNVETIPRLYPEVRPKAVYSRSLELLARAKELAPATLTKSGVMVGLGETHAEVLEAFEDLRKADCDILTVGQYLAPSTRHHPVAAYVAPEEFGRYEEEGYRMGFRFVASGPLVRSSYRAEEALGAGMAEKE